MCFLHPAEGLIRNGAIDETDGRAGHAAKQIVENAQIRVCVSVCGTG
jgi:hypothetical protein